MKHIEVLSLLSLIFLLTVAMTWEGELDPTKFSTWNPLTISQPNDDGVVSAMAGNPDKKSSIKRAKLRILQGQLLSYEYFKNGDVFMYYRHTDRRFKEGYFKRRSYKVKDLRADCLMCHETELTNIEPFTEEEREAYKEEKKFLMLLDPNAKNVWI